MEGVGILMSGTDRSDMACLRWGLEMKIMPQHIDHRERIIQLSCAEILIKRGVYGRCIDDKKND